MSKNYQKSRPPLRRETSKVKIKQYFTPKPVSTIAIIITTAGVLLVLVGLFLFIPGPSLFPFLLVLVGAILCFLGAHNVYTVLRSNPGDQDYDAWLEKQAAAAIPRALRQLNVQDDQVTNRILRFHSIILPGSILADNYHDVRLKQGQDGIWRSNLNLYTFFFPADQFMAIYTRSIDALDPRNMLDDKTEEYFYRHIISASFSVFQDQVTIEGEVCLYRVQQFSLRLSNGDDIRLGGYLSAIPFDHKRGAPDIILPDTRINQTLADLRVLLRHKRQRGR